jgi:hypothetical protein
VRRVVRDFGVGSMLLETESQLALDGFLVRAVGLLR